MKKLFVALLAMLMLGPCTVTNETELSLVQNSPVDCFERERNVRYTPFS